MPDFTQKTLDNNILLFDPSVFADPSSAIFEAEYWRSQNCLSGTSVGRGTTYFFKYGSKEYVLRHYLRGGLIGKCLEDQYFFTGVKKTRAWRELQLLAQMRNLGLPVPRPIGAQITKNLLYYRADLIIERIGQASDAHQLLSQGPLENDIWHSIGACIAEFHRHQVFHHDLNIHNIMLDDQQRVWLIDFDKCEFKAGDSWKKANLNRLERSLNKERGLNTAYHYSQDAMQYLLLGYYGKESLAKQA
jgi:3-deoxy-D-manno-octulosonic acid kinase